MKKFLSIVAAFFLFLLLNVIGGVFYHPFHMEARLQDGRSFVWDGVGLMFAAWLLLLLLGAARKRFTASALPLTIALVLSGLAGFLLKVGFVTHNW